MDENGKIKTGTFIVVVYEFSESCKLKPHVHGNTKKSNKPFSRVTKDTKEKVQKKLQYLSPKGVRNEILTEAGGIFNAKPQDLLASSTVSSKYYKNITF